MLNVAGLSKISVEASTLIDSNSANQNVPVGLDLMRKSDCFNCHAMNRQLVGPALIEIANKYRDQPHQLEQSVKRVIQGSTGVWGKVAMLPHSQHTPEQVHQMVDYVFSCKADSANPTSRSITGQLEFNKPQAAIRLEAVYNDLGRGDIPSQSGTSSVVLRSRHIQAEEADEYRGARPLNQDQAQGKRFMGAIEHDGYLKFKGINLDQVGKVVVRAASAGAGGTIEVRRSSFDGPLLGETIVEVNGDWHAFSDKVIDVHTASGKDDIYLVFKNARQRAGLMNIDSVEFSGKIK